MFRRIAPALLLILLACVFFAPLALQPAQVLYSDHSDMLAMHLPMKRFLVRSWQEYGRLPAWCPYSFGGMPFLSDVQVAAFYPLHFPFLFLQEQVIGTAMSWAVLLHVIIAGLTMYAYCRHRGLNTVGAMAAAILFMFAGKWLLHIFAAGHYIMTPLAWLPLVLLFFERSVNRRSIASAVFAGAVFALIILGTHPQVTLYAGLVAAAWSFAVLRDAQCNEPIRNWLSRWLLYGVVTALTGGLLGAVQLLPAIEAAGQASRGIGVPIEEIIGVFGPGLFSFMGPDASPTWESNGGFGPVAISLLLMVPCFRPGQFRSQLCCFAALVLFSLGGAALVQPLPGFRLFQIPVRMLLPAAFPAAFLCGVSVDWLSKQGSAERSVKLVLWGTCGLALLLNIRYWPNPVLSVPSIPAKPWAPYVIYWGVVALVAAAVYRLIRRQGTRTWVHNSLLIASLLAESWALTWRHVSVRPIESIYPLNPVAERLAAAARDAGSRGPWRVLDRCVPDDASLSPLGSALPMFGAVQVEPILGYNSFDIRRYKELLQIVLAEHEPLLPRHGAFGFPITDIFPIVHKSVLDLLGTKYLSQPHQPNLLESDPEGPGKSDSWRLVEVVEHPGETYSFLTGGMESLPAYAIYENTRALPRAFLVHDWRRLELDRTMDQMAETDFSQIVLLEKDPPASRPTRAAKVDEKVTFKSSGLDRHCLQVDAAEPGYLVLTETAYPGWTCTVDGKKADIERADFAFQAVYLPAGAHEVIFEFAPRSLFIGGVLSWVGLAGVVTVGIGNWLIRRTKVRKGPNSGTITFQ